MVLARNMAEKDKETKESQRGKKQELLASEKHIEVVKLRRDVFSLLSGEQIQRSNGFYRELEYVLHGMLKNKVPIELIEFVQGDNVSYAVRIGRYGFESSGAINNLYWRLYGHDPHYDKNPVEIKRINEIIRNNFQPDDINTVRSVNVEDDAVNKYLEKWSPKLPLD